MTCTKMLAIMLCSNCRGMTQSCLISVMHVICSHGISNHTSSTGRLKATAQASPFFCSHVPREIFLDHTLDSLLSACSFCTFTKSNLLYPASLCLSASRSHTAGHPPWLCWPVQTAISGLKYQQMRAGRGGEGRHRAGNKG